MDYNISPGYLDAAGTRLLAGRNLTLHDDDKAPKVALVNRQFAVKVFGSVEKAIGGHFKFWGGERAEVVGVVEDGKYRTLTEDQMPAMFFSFLQQKTPGAWLVVRVTSAIRRRWCAALESTLHGIDAGLPLKLRTWTEELNSALFAARVATVALGVLGLLGAMLAVTGIFGMASYSVSKRLRELGIRVALGAGQQAGAARFAGTGVSAAGIGSVAGLGAGTAGDAGAVVHRLPGHAEGSAGAGRRVRDHAAAGIAGGVDSGAPGAGCRSADPAARRIAAVKRDIRAKAAPAIGGAAFVRVRVARAKAGWPSYFFRLIPAREDMPPVLFCRRVLPSRRESLARAHLSC